MARGKSQAQKLRTVLPLGAVALFSLVLLFFIVPLSQFQALQSLNFTALTYTFWLFFVGLLFISIGILAIPDFKNTPAKIAGLFFIGFGLIAFIFAILVMVDGSIDVLLSDPNLRFFTTILFAGASIILLAELIPRILTGKGMVETARNV